MRILSRQTFKISDLALPADFEQTKLHPDVPNLAESIKTHGLIQEPGVENGSNSLDWGRKRVAAFLKLGQSHIPVAIVEYDYPEEKEIITLRENLDRHEVKPEDRRKFRARIAELEEKRAARERDHEEAAWPDEGPTVDRDDEFSQDGSFSGPDGAENDQRVNGRSKGRPSKGRAEAAKKLGISPGQLRKDLRKAKKEAAGETEEEEAAPPSPPIELHGLEMDAVELEKIRAIQVALDNAGAAMRKAMGLIKPIGQLDNYPRDRFQKVYGEMKFIASLLKQGRPAWVCLDCKLVPLLRSKCARCNSSGYIVEQQTEEVPEELKRTGDKAGVFINGKFKLLSGLGR